MHAWMQSRCNIWLRVLRNVGRCIGVYTTPLQKSIVPSMKIYVGDYMLISTHIA